MSESAGPGAPDSRKILGAEPGPRKSEWRLLGSLRVIGSWTLLSRLLGYVRDALTFAVLGGSSWQLDTFLAAFPIPNLFRRLLGEGALASAFLPLFSEARQKEGDQAAWRFASLVFSLLAVLLLALALGGEVVFGIALRVGATSPKSVLFLRLLQMLFPYLVPICLAALVGTMLQAVGRFARPAFAPNLLNVGWLAGLGVLCFWHKTHVPQTAVMTIAIAVLFSGLLQLGVVYGGLREFHAGLAWRSDRADPRFRQMLALLAPAAVGGGIFQLNVLADQLIALYGVKQAGGVSALYLAQRILQFPLALVGIAMATVSFAALSEAVGRQDEEDFRRTLATAVTGVVVLALPAGVAMMVLAGPAVRLLFERMAFGHDASVRAATVLTVYAAGLWAYCVQQVLVRAYHARKDMRTPVRIGIPMVGLNLTLNLLLVGPLAECGLALATVITTTLQVGLLSWNLRPWLTGEAWRQAFSRMARALVASAVMGGAILLSLRLLPAGDRLVTQALSLAGAVLAGAATYLGLAWLLGIREVWDLFREKAAEGTVAGV
jgi:putative peptidoglycan lipid II flippase